MTPFLSCPWTERPPMPRCRHCDRPIPTRGLCRRCAARAERVYRLERRWEERRAVRSAVLWTGSPREVTET